MTGIKRLPIAKSPIVGLQYLAYPLSIILNYEECYPWFYSNYIQLRWSRDLKNHLTFYFPGTEKIPEMLLNPWLDGQIMQKGTLESNDIDSIRLFIKSIDEGYYIYSWFDEFYVPKRLSYKKNHFIHDFMITGYNTDEKVFYLLGYSDRSLLETTKIKFEQLQEAMFSHNEKSGSWLHNEVTLLKKSDDCDYKFDLNHVCSSLEDYLLETDTSKNYSMFVRPNSELIYGMSVYEYLKKYFILLADKKITFSLNMIHILYEHKKCMSMRLEYMERTCGIKDIDSIKSAFADIENIALDARNLQIKYMMDYNPSTLLKINEKLNEMEPLEKQTIERLLEKIIKVL